MRAFANGGATKARIVLVVGLLTTVGAALPLAAPTFADASPMSAVPARVRGVVTGLDEETVTITGRDGTAVRLRTGPETTYAYVVPASLGDVKVDDYVGTAVEGPPTSMTALELVIVPEGMRAGRTSYYGWDPLPDTTGRHRVGNVPSSMTNGTVSNAARSKPEPTGTPTTHGPAPVESGARSRTLTVTYEDGKVFLITVPPTAPVTRFEVTDRSALVMGSAVFVKTGPGDRADFVAVGKGLIPPM